MTSAGSSSQIPVFEFCRRGPGDGMGHLPTLAVGLTQQGREVDAMRKAPAAGERVRTRHPIFARTRTQRQTDLVRLVGHAATLCANDSADHRTKDLPYAITH